MFNFRSWKIILAGLLSVRTIASAVTTQDADLAILSFNANYWNAGGKYFYKQENHSGLLDFWMSAHTWETVMEIYVRTGSPEYKTQIKDMYDGFNAKFGADWSRNPYNDDIMWWVLASTRAYDITGDTRYLTQSKTYFDWVYKNQTDMALGGGIWWNIAHTQKNSCVVQPAVMSAMNLARQLKDDSYRVKAESLFAWQKRTLTQADGKVFDHIDSKGVVAMGSLTYNQGTFIGAALAMGKIQDAEKAADWTKANLADANGILKTEGTGQSDYGTFKTIFIRYCVQLGKIKGEERYLTWLESNAAQVWKNRRTKDNLMGFDWANAAPATGLECQSATGGVALMNLLAAPTTGLAVSRSGSRLRLEGQGADGGAAYLSGSGTMLMPFLGRVRSIDGRSQPLSR